MVGGRELASIPVRSQQTGFDRQERVALDRCDFSCIFLISVFELTFIPCLYFRCIGSWSTYCFGAGVIFPPCSFFLCIYPPLYSITMPWSMYLKKICLHLEFDGSVCDLCISFLVFLVSISCWLSLNIPVTYVAGISFGR